MRWECMKLRDVLFSETMVDPIDRSIHPKFPEKWREILTRGNTTVLMMFTMTRKMIASSRKAIYVAPLPHARLFCSHVYKSHLGWLDIEREREREYENKIRRFWIYTVSLKQMGCISELGRQSHPTFSDSPNMEI